MEEEAKGFSERDAVVASAIPLLVNWYRQNKKDLPWRRDPTPYHVWISEIMLQQTRIEAAIGYYERFLSALPDVASLASIEDDALLKLWQGLGYYSRARNLKKAAILVMERYGGKLPCNVSELRTLPGIGDYTAGAIASIAYGKAEPAVDGNVLRVLSRLLASDADVMLPATRRDMTRLLASHYPAGADAAALTEGLMELGEVVCIPNGEAKCHCCPVASLCLAKRQGRANALPVRTGPKKRRVEQRTVLLMQDDIGRFALNKRPENGLLAGMWEFASFDGALSEDAVIKYLAEQDIKVHTIEPDVAAHHVFSHIEWEMKSYFLTVSGSGRYCWATSEEIMVQYAIPSAYRTYLKRIRT